MTVCHAAVDPSSASAGQEESTICSLLDTLRLLTDPRNPQGKRHTLVFAVACAVIAVLAGSRNYRQIGSQVTDFSQSLPEKLGATWSWFTLRYMGPSESTLRRVLQSIDAAELDLLVGCWLFERAHRDTEDLLVIALDGKVLRGSWTDAGAQVTLFSAMIHGVGVTIGQIKVPETTNEITQVANLLTTIPLGKSDHVLVTMDAAHTQRDTAEHLSAELGFDYLMTVKGNQPTLQHQVLTRCRPLLSTPPGHGVEERAHGRIRRWSTWATDAAGLDFPHAAQLGVIRRAEWRLQGVSASPGLTWGEGSYVRSRIGQVLPAPDQARCEPSRGSQVKPGDALTHSPLETANSGSTK